MLDTIAAIGGQLLSGYLTKKDDLPRIGVEKIRQLSPDTYCFSFCVAPGKASRIIERIEIPGWQIAEVKPMWKDPEIQEFVLPEDLTFADSSSFRLEVVPSSKSSWVSLFGKPKSSSDSPLSSRIALQLSLTSLKVRSDKLMNFEQVTETR